MVATIDLYHKPVCRTAEIHDVRADGVLPTKLGVIELPIAQLPSKYPLTVGLPSSQPSDKPTAPAPLTLPLSPSGGEGSFTSLNFTRTKAWRTKNMKQNVRSTEVSVLKDDRGEHQ